MIRDLEAELKEERKSPADTENFWFPTSEVTHMTQVASETKDPAKMAKDQL